MPLLDTPGITQDKPHNCGAAAFHILFRYHFPKKPLPDWGELADPVRGLGPDALELFVRKEFRNISVGHLDLKHLRFLSTFTPVLCIVTVGPEADHWVCVRGVTGGYVHVQDPDPEHPRHRYTHAEWFRAWRDTTAGGAFQRYGLTGWRS
jgi:ABC-type bacteriocin/lantibiotic exporter with double-glycine peptidase domain